MKADLELMQWLIDNQTQFEISKNTGVAQPNISYIKTGKRPLDGMSMRNAIKLTEYAIRLRKERGLDV